MQGHANTSLLILFGNAAQYLHKANKWFQHSVLCEKLLRKINKLIKCTLTYRQNTHNLELVLTYKVLDRLGQPGGTDPG